MSTPIAITSESSSLRKRVTRVLGYGAPIVDLILKIDSSYLAQVPGEPHGTEVVDHGTLERLVDESGELAIPIPGGSASNMVRGMSMLGQDCAILGKAGRDQLGRQYVKGLAKVGVQGLLAESDLPTSTVLSLVEPDGQRTMRVFLGASEEMAPEDVNPDHFRQLDLLVVEGYALRNWAPAERAIELAKEAGARVAIDLAAFELVREKEAMLGEILPRWIDIVFANELEHREIGADQLREWCEVAVLMEGKEGCRAYRGSEEVHQKAFLVEHPIDTTGAGDLFAAGFLHAFLEGQSLQGCARAGCLTGAEVVQVMGAIIPSGRFDWLRKRIASPLVDA